MTMNPPKILIADKMSPLATQTFEALGVETDIRTGLDEAELIKSIGEYDGLAVRSSTRATEAVIEAGIKGKLKVIGRAGIGVDNIDGEAATRAGVVVMNTPFGNSITTAEHAIAMMMAVARQIPAANQSTQAGKWEKSRFMGVELHGKTLGLIGAGNIGAIVASLAMGLKMKVIAYDPFLNEERANTLNIRKVDFETCLSQADFLTIHTPLTKQTHHLLDANALSKCKTGIRIINCARGGIIDEQALANALDAGKVAGAALDVFEEEPAKTNLLFDRDDVVCTPHLGASTSEAQEKVAVQLAEQMADYLINGAVTNALNMPSVTAEEAPILRPYMALADKMGRFGGQVVDDSITAFEVTYCGHASKINHKPLTQTLLAGLLSPSMQNVNMVNAEFMADQRGIKVCETVTASSEDYPQQICLSVKTESGVLELKGTLSSDNVPRLVKINDIKIEVIPQGHMLYVANLDKPGLVGNIGTLLGDANMNIGTFALGRNQAGGKALAILSLDVKPQPEIINALAKIAHVTDVKSLYFS